MQKQNQATKPNRRPKQPRSQKNNTINATTMKNSYRK
jgi:hypothetical protein